MNRIALTLVPCVFIILLASCARGPQQREGVISFLSGDVSLRTDAAAVPAKIGDNVRFGMSLITGEKSVAEVTLDEGVVRVQRNTTVRFSELLRNGDGANRVGLVLNGGEVAMRVARRLATKDHFQVSTPTIIAAVRGTQFRVTDPAGGVSVACFEGKVAVWRVGEDESSALILEAGQMVRDEKGGPLVARPIVGAPPTFSSGAGESREKKSAEPGPRLERIVTGQKAKAPDGRKETITEPVSRQKTEAPGGKKETTPEKGVAAPAEKKKPEADLPR